MSTLSSAVKFDYTKIAIDEAKELHMMVSLEAPVMEENAERVPLNISAVIDESGSMSGAKITYVKVSLHKMLDHMTERDRMGLVGFTTGVREIMAPALMTPENKEKFRHAIDALSGKSMTNFSGGLFRGFEQMSGAPNGALNRILMFTDGLANQGVTDLETLTSNIVSSITNHSVRDITISCFGYGQDVDTNFLETISKVGKGNYYYIDKPDNAPKAFAKELGGLLSTFAQNIRVEVSPKENVELLDVLNDVDVTTEDGKTIIALDDILSEEKRHIVMKIKVPALTNGLAARPFKLCDIEIIYHNTLSGKKTVESLKAKIEAVKAEDVQQKPGIDVEEQIAVFKAAAAVQQATTLADAGDYVQAAFVMSEAKDATERTQAFAEGSVLAKGVAAEMGAFSSSVGNEATYLSTSNSVKSFTTSLKRGRSSGSSGGYFDNSAQRKMTFDFSSSADASVESAPAEAKVAPEILPHSTYANTEDDAVEATTLRGLNKTRKSKRDF